MITTLALSLFVAIPGQTPWLRPASLIVDGQERLGSGKEMPFRIQVSGGNQVFATRRGIVGWQGGPTRLEANTSSGTMTWLEGGNRALILVGPSHPDLRTWLSPVRFSRDQVSRNAIPNWTVEPAAQIAGREVWLAKNNRQSLWIDQMTGMTLGQEDRNASNAVSYRKTITSFQPGVAVPEFAFAPTRGSRIISGIPYPSILVASQLERSQTEYDADVAATKKKSKVSANLWFRKISIPDNYSYVGTHYEESAGKPVTEVWPRNMLGAPEIEPGGLPPGWTVSGEVNEQGNYLFRFSIDGNPGPMIMIAPPQGQQGSSFGMTMQKEGEEMQSVNYTAFYGPDGALAVGVGSEVMDARMRRENRRLDMSKASSFAQTDFIEKSGGNTVSLLQVRGRDWKACALLPVLTESKKISKSGRTYDSWTFKGSFPLNIVSWDERGVTNVMAASKLSHDQLIELASSAS